VQQEEQIRKGLQLWRRQVGIRAPRLTTQQIREELLDPRAVGIQNGGNGGGAEPRGDLRVSGGALNQTLRRCRAWFGSVHERNLPRRHS
jgi:hypothetical protein